jgi:peroxiredoxin
MIHFIKTRKTQLNKLLSKILGAGKQFPSFHFTKENGDWSIDFPEDKQQFSLEEIAQGKPILITYYVPEWKEYAEQQLWLLQKSVRRLSELGVQILTITNLSIPKIKELKRTKRLTFLSIMMIIKRLQKLLGCCQSNRHVHNSMQEFQKIFLCQQVS